MDYFHSVGALGFASRLKRLSDVCMAEVKDIYSASGLDFEPKWFPLFHLLYGQEEITVTEAASQLHLTHPHISQLVKEMLAAKLISLRAHRSDKRSRRIVMSPKGKAMAKALQPIWDNIGKAVSDVIYNAEPEFLMRLGRVERAFKERPFSLAVRKMAKINIQKHCRIIYYTPALKADFERLNREWLEKNWAVEEIDIQYFNDPQKRILSPGGDILFAELDGDIVGTCSLLREGGTVELAKMAVTEPMRGKGIGEFLAKEAIKRAKQKKVKTLTLVTHSSLMPAIRLYEKLGFKETFRGQHPKYKRGDLIMEKTL